MTFVIQINNRTIVKNIVILLHIVEQFKLVMNTVVPVASSSSADIERSFVKYEIVPDTLSVAPKQYLNVRNEMIKNRTKSHEKCHFR